MSWALIFGIAVSTFFTLIVVPLVYYMAYGEKESTRKPDELPSGTAGDGFAG